MLDRPIIGSAWFSIGAFLLFNSILNYLPDAYPEYAASVLAGVCETPEISPKFPPDLPDHSTTS